MASVVCTQSVFGIQLVGEGELKPGEEQGPEGLRCVEAFGCFEVLQVFMVNGYVAPSSHSSNAMKGMTFGSFSISQLAT